MSSEQDNWRFTVGGVEVYSLAGRRDGAVVPFKDGPDAPLLYRAKVLGLTYVDGFKTRDEAKAYVEATVALKE